MQVAIDLPNDLVASQGVASVREELRQSYALWLFQRERVTLAKAAEVADMSLYDFMALCKASQIPIMDISREELTAELAGGLENSPSFAAEPLSIQRQLRDEWH